MSASLFGDFLGALAAAGTSSGATRRIVESEADGSLRPSPLASVADNFFRRAIVGHQGNPVNIHASGRLGAGSHFDRMVAACPEGTSDVVGALAVAAAGRLAAHATSRLGFVDDTHASTDGASSNTASAGSRPSQSFQTVAMALGAAVVAAGQSVAAASSRPQRGDAITIREPSSQQLGYGAVRANARGVRRSSATGPYSSSSTLTSMIPIISSAISAIPSVISSVEVSTVPRPSSSGTPVSRAAQLPVHAITAQEVCGLGPDGKECTVCISGFQPGDELVTLPCFHRFHCECAGRWFERSQECPVCRHPIADAGLN